MPQDISSNSPCLIFSKTFFHKYPIHVRIVMRAMACRIVQDDDAIQLFFTPDNWMSLFQFMGIEAKGMLPFQNRN